MGSLTQNPCRAGLWLARHFAFLVGLSTAPLSAEALSEAEILARTDAALQLLDSGAPAAAADLLEPLYDAAFRDAELSVRAANYPLLALAYVAHADARWSRAARMASTVAGTLEFSGLRGSDLWLRAQVIQGAALYQMGETTRADAALRATFPALAEAGLPRENQLALFTLARIASEARAADQAGLRRAFLQHWRPGGFVRQADALHIWFFDIVARFKDGADRTELVGEMAELRDAAAQVADMEPRQALHYRGYHGFLKAHAGDFDAAQSDLRAYFELLMAEGLYGRDLWENALHLGAVTGQTQGPDAQIAFLEAFVPLARREGASAWFVAQYLREAGHAAAQTGAQDRAQSYYRAAYAEARRSYRTNAGLVTQLRGFIDLQHPGLAGFAYAGELGALERADIEPHPFGEDVLRLFFEGNYTVAQALVERNGLRDAPADVLNVALLHALLGAPEPARRWLGTARNGQVEHKALADLTEAVAMIWGSSHEVEKAGELLDRLDKADLPPALRRMGAALRAQRAFHLDSPGAQRAALEAFYDLPVDNGGSDYWRLFASVMAMESSFGLLAETENASRYHQLRSDIEAVGNLPVLRDYLDVVYYQNARSGLFAADAVAHLSALNSRLAEDTPTGHPLRLVAAFTLSNALYWRGENAAALEWAERAAAELAANAHPARDVLSFIRARQADLLRILGAPDRAASVAADAWSMAREARGEFAGAVLESYANALYAFTGDPARVVQVLRAELQQEDRFDARERVALWSLLAQAQAASATRGDVVTSLNRAMDAMATPGVDWRSDRARLLWTRAQTHARHSDLRAAFADMIASNDLYHAWRQDRFAREDADTLDGTAWRERVRWEAALGWQLAQEVRP